jgi:PEP-CTERM motif-containing protein
MKLVRNCVAAALATVVMTGIAQAGPISFSDTFNPTDRLLLNSSATNCTGTNDPTDASDVISPAGSCGTLTYTHILQPSYNPATDTLFVGSGLLTITVYDDADNGNEQLNYDLDFGALLGGFPTPPDSLDSTTLGSPYVKSINVLAQIAADGTLVVKLTQQSGDVFFAKSELIARGERTEEVIDEQQPTVPEPTTLALLGLAAVASFGRKRFA